MVAKIRVVATEPMAVVVGVAAVAPAVASIVVWVVVKGAMVVVLLFPMLPRELPPTTPRSRQNTINAGVQVAFLLNTDCYW